MTDRVALPAFDGPHPQYNEVVTDYAGNILGQVRAFTHTSTFETTQAGRVGSSTKKTLKKTLSHEVSMEIWSDDDLAEIAIALNGSTPAAGEIIKLDPDATATTLYVRSYDAEAITATHLSTTGIYQYVAISAEVTRDEDSEQVVSISGTAEAIYTIKEIG